LFYELYQVPYIPCKTVKNIISMMETFYCIQKSPPRPAVLHYFSNVRLSLDQDIKNSFTLPNPGLHIGLPSTKTGAVSRQCAKEPCLKKLHD